MAAPFPVFEPDPIDLVPLKRQITLRNVKGSALTYAEMDKNFSSFFYSASLSSTNLLLHYTGSTVLGAPYTPSSIIVPLNPLLATIQQLTVAGQAGDVQYKVDSATLGANSSFKWDAVNFRLGVGTPSPATTLHVTNPITSAPTRLRISTLGTSTGNNTAALEFALGNTVIGSIGKTSGNTSDLYINSNVGTSIFTAIGSTNILQTNATGLGVKAIPNTDLTVQGVLGVGSDTTANQGLIGSIGTKVLVTSLPSNSTLTGLLVESPKNTAGSLSGGHVVVGLNQTVTNTSYAFSVIAGSSGAYTTPLLTVKADGKIGVNKANPTQALDIVGNTTMTGTLYVSGTTTLVTTADSLGANSKVLTVNGSGLVQYANNLMPLGGIIMWAGSSTALPTGWKLCDGTGTWGGANPIPDLRERFIVGAGGDNTGITTYQYDRTGATVNDFTFVYYGSPVMDNNKKVNTDNIGESYDEYYPTDPAKVTAFGDPAGYYSMYDTGGNYFYYINYNGTIGKGNTRDWDGNVAAPSNLNTLFPQPATWAGDVYYSSINQYSQAYGWYHVYQKKFNLNQTAATGTSSWYWIFDKRTQNYSLVRGTFNGDSSVGTNVGNIWYKTGPSVGYSYTPFQKYVQAGASTTDTNGQLTKNNARRIQMQGIQYPGGTYSVGDTGGFNDVQLTKATTPQHTHIGDRNSGGWASGGDSSIGQGTGYRNNTRVTSYVGGDQYHENRPPYYALAFIIYTGI